MKLLWGTPDPHACLGLPQKPVDVLLACDVVYGRDDAGFHALAETLAALAGPQTVLLFGAGNGAAPGVQRGEGSFFERCAALGAVWERMPKSMLRKEHRQTSIG